MRIVWRFRNEIGKYMFTIIKVKLAQCLIKHRVTKQWGSGDRATHINFVPILVSLCPTRGMGLSIH